MSDSLKNAADAVIEKIIRDMQQLSDMGVIEYYLPSIPEGERFVVGVDGRIFNMSPEEAMCFLTGSTAAALYMKRRQSRLWPT